MMFNVYGKGFLPLSTTFYHFLPPYLTLDDLESLSGGGLVWWLPILSWLVSLSYCYPYIKDTYGYYNVYHGWVICRVCYSYILHRSVGLPLLLSLLLYYLKSFGYWFGCVRSIWSASLYACVSHGLVMYGCCQSIGLSCHDHCWVSRFKKRWCLTICLTWTNSWWVVFQ